MLAEFLKLFDFSPEELERETPRTTRTFEILGITESDISRGIERIHTYFDMSLLGVRGLFACHLITLNDHVLAREEGAEKIVYGEWPLPVQVMQAAKIAAPPNVFIGAPTMALNVVLGQIFGKIAPVTEAGEKCGQPAGNGHCALYQTLLGAIELGMIPMPDLFLASGFLCDPPTAAAEVLHMTHGVPIIYCDGHSDSPWGHWPKTWERQVQYFGYQAEKATDDIGRAMGFEITEEHKRKAIRMNAALVYNHQRANNLVATADPQPLSHVSLILAGLLYDVPLTEQLLLKAIDATDTLADEVQERVEKGIGIVEKGAPRVYLSLAVLVDPAVVRMIEQSGLSVTSTFFQLFPPRALFATPYRGFGIKVAESIQKLGAFCSVYGYLEFLKDYVPMCNLDGMIYCYPHHCKTYAIPTFMIKKEMETKFNIPVMALEGDIYDSRNYSAEQMRTRVETFAEMLRDAKLAAGMAGQPRACGCE